jgi:proteic killer suppression protein
MIQSFKLKGLERFFRAGMDLLGLYLHQLTGDRKETWSVRVSGNWRITFRFNGVHAEIVDYEDYH